MWLFEMMVPVFGPRLCKVYRSFWNDIICRVSTKPWTFLYNLNFVRAIFTFWTGAKIVWWLLITSVQCIAFLLSCIDRMLNYGLRSQQMVLHTNLQSEKVLTIFTVFFFFFFFCCCFLEGGGGGGNHIQQLIILKVIMIRGLFKYECK